MKVIKNLALVFIVVGAVLLGGPVFGFSSFAADRDADVNVADDTSAYLGIFDNSPNQSADVISKNGGEGTVYYLDDNTGTFDAAAIDAEVIEFSGSSTGLVAQVDTTDTTHDFAVGVSCGTSDLKDTGNVTIHLNASDNPTIDLERTTSSQIEVDCKGKSSALFEVTSAASTGDNNNTAVIDIKNNGAAETVKGISIDSTSSSADTVNNGNNPEIIIGNSNVNRNKKNKNKILIDGTEYKVKGGEDIASGETVQITISEFRDGTSTVEMSGKTVEFSLYSSNSKIQTIQTTLS
ncbi:hypothetical protein [Natrinema sp. HArc-T2]|uniref:hypothetical protein n=1 Tax=Natrinema sp. HArc-T2 TaxID=3242701 RepID=UPI00359D6781